MQKHDAEELIIDGVISVHSLSLCHVCLKLSVAEREEISLDP